MFKMEYIREKFKINISKHNLYTWCQFFLKLSPITKDLLLARSAQFQYNKFIFLLSSMQCNQKYQL